jgi:hypothetical protein
VARGLLHHRGAPGPAQIGEKALSLAVDVRRQTESCLEGGEWAIKPETYLIKQVRPKNARLVQPLDGYAQPRPDRSGMGPDRSSETG